MQVADLVHLCAYVHGGSALPLKTTRQTVGKADAMIVIANEFQVLITRKQVFLNC